MGNPADDPPDFTLTDADGDEHEYWVTPHDPHEGTRIAVTISSALTGPLGQLLDSAAGELLTGESDFQDMEVESILEGVEFDRVAAALSDSLDEDKVPALIKKILRQTYRDEQPLSGDTVFADAYRQNYLELYRAAWEVIRFNGFFGSFGT